MEFEWDEAKREANLRKHGVDFLRAALIFENAILEQIDDREDYGEERMIALGEAEGVVYRVTYTTRDACIRIISAMKASRNEQKIYYQTLFARRD